MTGALVVIAPHPDDEILGAAGIMARALASGERIGVIVLTDGARSDPATGAHVLAAQRSAECQAGLAALLGRVPPLLMLGHGDGALDARQPALDDDARLTRFLRAIDPVTVLVTDPADGHVDHKAAFGLAARIVACGLAQKLVVMPISQRIDGPCDLAGFEALPVADHAAAKRAAIAAHHSQTKTLGGFCLTGPVCDAFAETEYVRPVYDRNGDVGRPQLIAADHFDALFSKNDDPWGYQTSDYEADRFARTIAVLGGRRYRAALELGCANGVLTHRLAAYCDNITAVDASATALAIARKRLAHVDDVTLLTGNLPDALPSGSFDLIVLSDFLYYLGFVGCVRLAHSLQSRAAPGCRIVIANYLGQTECALSGDMAAEIMIAHLPGWAIKHQQRCDRLRIDVLDLP
jgi:LmbE family N-acetylglucosaminyl deacetylase